MKPLQVADDIVPVGEFKARMAETIRRLRETGRAVVLTHHGKPAAVLITPQEFDRICERERFVKAVGQGLADGKAGRVIDDAELADELEAEFGGLELKE